VNVGDRNPLLSNGDQVCKWGALNKDNTRGGNRGDRGGLKSPHPLSLGLLL